MPIYVYRCKDCGHEFEQRQRMMDDPLTDCPVCEGDIRRVVNSVGVVFKGSGFYVTDNRNGSGPKSTTASSTSDANSKESNSDNKKSDDKAVKTADTKSGSSGTTSAAAAA